MAAGVAQDVAESFLAPDGVLPRMRLLSAGFVKPGDSFRAPTDSGWWAAVYRFPLWNPLGTYADAIGAVLDGGPVITFDEDVARGDAAAISHAMTALELDAQELLEAPCPKWLIPPKKGQMPTPNPECARKEVVEREKQRQADRERKRKEKEAENKSRGVDIIVVLGVLVLAYYAGKKALR